jgi:coenzyme PQQ precursor peptide PqqA
MEHFDLFRVFFRADCVRMEEVVPSLSARQSVVPTKRKFNMAWKTPKIVEVPVGMEINMYACAARK